MVAKAGCLLFTLLVGGLAFPLNEEPDQSIFFDHTNSDSPSRIIGGSSSGTVRHMVALNTGVYTKVLTCGGSLITNYHVLTAAHCVQSVFHNGALLNSLRGTVGTNRWNRGGTQYQFSGNITHPNYVHNIIKNDLGILITSISVVQNNNIRTVPISYDFIQGGVPAEVHGWGRTRVGGSMSSSLNVLRPTVVDGDRCVKDVAARALAINMNVPAVQPHIEICTFSSEKSGTCNGDSGGGLLRRSDGRLIGVVSWGLPCARNAPDMFARLSAYRTWIERSTS